VLDANDTKLFDHKQERRNVIIGSLQISFDKPRDFCAYDDNETKGRVNVHVGNINKSCKNMLLYVFIQLY